MYGILKLRDQIQQKPDLGWRARYEAGSTIEVLGTEGVPGGGGSITTTAPGLTLPPTANGTPRA